MKDINTEDTVCLLLKTYVAPETARGISELMTPPQPLGGPKKHYELSLSSSYHFFSHLSRLSKNIQ